MIGFAERFVAEDIEKSFDQTILKRGRGYFNDRRVIAALFDENGDLQGMVRGSEGQTYRVLIEFQKRTKFTKLESSCSCPYATQCKHGAALALFALGREFRQADHKGETPKGNSEHSKFELALEAMATTPSSVAVEIPYEVKNWLRHLEQANADDNATDPSAKQQISYHLHLQSIGSRLVPAVQAVTQNILKSGALGATSWVKVASIGSHMTPPHWTALDAAVLVDLEALCAKTDSYSMIYKLDGRHGSDVLCKLISTGRCYWNETVRLKQGDTIQGRFEWHAEGKTGTVKPIIRAQPSALILPLDRPWYVDASTGECGCVECELPTRLVASLLQIGPLMPEHVPAVRKEMEALDLPQAALPQIAQRVVVRAPKPVPKIQVELETCGSKSHILYGRSQVFAPIPFAKLTFEYEGIQAPENGDDIRIVTPDEMLILQRNEAAERQAIQVLLAAGWESTSHGWDVPQRHSHSLCMRPPDFTKLTAAVENLAEFSKKHLPKLAAAGWGTDEGADVRTIPDSEVEWDIELASGSGVDWFEFRLGIRVEGESLDLRTILGQILRPETKQQLFGAKAKAKDVFHFSLAGKIIQLSRKRLLAIVQPLIELFGDPDGWPEDLRLSKSLLSETAEFQESLLSAKVPWKTDAEITRLSSRLANFERLEPVMEPAGFGGQLRPYQREGLAWLQFLREYEFGGVLADDMGLGKTVQVLAHIQTEKIAGRMERPCLIVAPTSTIPNWRRESERFTPELKVLTLRGSDRATRFDSLGEADIVLTTYPLLARDKEQLLKWNYHMVVLDEAQNVKNASTAAAKAVRELTARHRLCLSGTPVENHLGELWSLFEFLMPGFLGTDAEFKRGFRTPIEKAGDAKARERLARRIRPFMLRRTKAQVVTELPPKTEIIESIEFGDPQRDLYESIRIVMDERVRSLLATQGLAKSRIQILDALLKLRQVCCDPRLVKLPSAKAVKESGKLDRLMEMLRVLVEDGRRVLLFSQFTSMLDLIEKRLVEGGIQWVRISGDTEDRETPVKRFQAGEVPLFLISLKAGGTGLNLTAADTVILYDPWWNPAVENQAIDRTHRIGQKKAVIVYRLVASGTIEEKMLQIQARKGDIARSILSDDADGIQALTANDLQWVLSGP